ncbi:hypothetical protein Tco_0749073 [Tanacetum coccineum]|uniref:Uncharacterized protein n=1 Tax=Tanacetum coccineum TaxID=301880 RepID=A0ABQ4YY48_9ASTR
MRRASKGYYGVVTPLFDTMLVQPQGEAPSTSPSRITSSPSLSSYHTPLSTLNTPPSFQTTHEAEETATMPHDSPLLGGHTPGSDEGRLKHDELIELLVLKVKKLEKQVRSGKARRRARIVLSEDEDAAEDPSKQGRKLAQIDTDPTISLVQDEGTSCGEKGEKEISTADVPVSTAGAKVSTAAASLVYIRRSASKAKDKGKAIMQEPEPPKKLKKRVQVQISVDEELARKVQEEEQAKAMAEQEQERVNFEAALEQQRYHALQNRPYSIAKVRKNMVMYLKNQAGYKQSYFKGMKYEEIRPIFEKVWDQTHTFVPMDSEDKEKDSKKKAGGSEKKTLAKKRAGEKQSDQSAKRQTTQSDTKKEELKAYLDIVPGEEFSMDFEADGSSKNYKIFSEMLDDFDRQDVLDLHRLVKARYMTSSPEGYDLMLWGDLKILFEPDEEDKVWKNQREYNLISWRLFDSCGIHILLMNNGISIHMITEKKYPLN